MHSPASAYFRRSLEALTGTSRRQLTRWFGDARFRVWWGACMAQVARETLADIVPQLHEAISSDRYSTTQKLAVVEAVMRCTTSPEDPEGLSSWVLALLKLWPGPVAQIVKNATDDDSAAPSASAPAAATSVPADSSSALDASNVDERAAQEIARIKERARRDALECDREAHRDATLNTMFAAAEEEVRQFVGDRATGGAPGSQAHVYGGEHRAPALTFPQRGRGEGGRGCEITTRAPKRRRTSPVFLVAKPRPSELRHLWEERANGETRCAHCGRRFSRKGGGRCRVLALRFARGQRGES